MLSLLLVLLLEVSSESYKNDQIQKIIAAQDFSKKKNKRKYPIMKILFYTRHMLAIFLMSAICF